MIEAGRYRWAASILDAYNRQLLRKTFRSLRVAGLENVNGTSPLLLAPNHSNWWDGCVALFISRTHLRRDTRLMMGEPELARHAIFSSLGVFSVPMDPAASRLESFRYALRQLDGNTVLWMFPQGTLRPARTPLELQRGVEVLSRRSGVAVCPVALRYEYLDGEKPDVLVRFGERIDPSGISIDALSVAMQRLLNTIDDDIVTGTLAAYVTVLAGKRSRDEMLDALLRRRRSDA